MSRPTLCLIAAVARNGAIGRNNQLLIHLPGDLPRFKRLTLGSAVIMGRKTWDSIGRPLPQRRNLVITHDTAWRADGAEPCASLDDALGRVAAEPRAFVIGGAQIYAQALPLADELALTEIDADLDGDVFFPLWDRSRFRQTESEEHTGPQELRYRFTHYVRIPQDPA
ncbi:MAG: dihydrofolate reductase [Burkholderiaceae bacterium]